ncbi:hypothetical protein BDA99DRAFT_449047 [Phascolomyces articulosus]|uniref:Uncharacterized protein n=1 Tax=Phascolomyces articulosus TaxID=60185 RepID=A0AAD5P6Y1_9FUNG|nr:hypothetical protein BDA99DRAFT_449047 [Phascolomyces articulosus]
MDFNHFLFRPFKKRRVMHTHNQALRKCCGCIHLRVGSAMACVIWMGLSLYFTIVSFQRQTFYSYLSDAPLIIFGVANLLLALVSFAALFAVYLDHWSHIRTAQHSIFICLFIVLVDGLINVILFITQRDDYIFWCINAGQGGFESIVNITEVNVRHDFYNCSRTWEDELKFGLLAIFMMIGFYVYWAMCFRSYRIKKAIIVSTMVGAPVDHVAIPSMPGGGGPPPPHLGGPHPHPPPMMPGGGMPMQPMGPGGPGGRNIIVLNNSKPSSKENNNKKSSPPPPYDS